MRTVEWLKQELAKFPDDAVCFAYEGEVIGIVIERPGKRLQAQGIIYCSEYNDENEKTILLDDI
ncbi:MAG: hypothetical protein ACE5GN_06645 [Waddliaceae bacterium]